MISGERLYFCCFKPRLHWCSYLPGRANQPFRLDFLRLLKLIRRNTYYVLFWQFVVINSFGHRCRICLWDHYLVTVVYYRDDNVLSQPTKAHRFPPRPYSDIVAGWIAIRGWRMLHFIFQQRTHGWFNKPGPDKEIYKYMSTFWKSLCTEGRWISMSCVFIMAWYWIMFTNGDNCWRVRRSVPTSSINQVTCAQLFSTHNLIL